MTDTLPLSVTFNTGTGRVDNGDDTVTCSVPTPGIVTAGAQYEWTFSVDVDPAVLPGTSLENRATAASDTLDPDATNNEANADTAIIGETALTLDKTGPLTVTAGDMITYTIVVTNLGPSVVQLLDIKDDLPNEVTFYDADIARGGAGHGGLCGHAVCQVNDVAVSEQVTVTLWGHVAPDLAAGSTITNEAQAFVNSDPEPDAWDEAATTVTSSSMLTITKAVLKDELCLGAYGLYELVVTNEGPSTASGVVVTDSLPPELIRAATAPSALQRARR